MKKLVLLASLFIALFLALPNAGTRAQSPDPTPTPVRVFFPFIQGGGGNPCLGAGVDMRRQPSTIIRQIVRGDETSFVADITAIRYEAHQIEVNVKGRTGPRVTIPADLYDQMGTSSAPKIFVNNQAVIRKVEEGWLVDHFLVTPGRAIGSGLSVGIGMAAGQALLSPPTNFTAVQQGNVVNFSWTPSIQSTETEIWQSQVAGPSGSAVRIYSGGGGAFAYPVAPGANSNLITVNPGFETQDFLGYVSLPNSSYATISNLQNHTTGGSYSARLDATLLNTFLQTITYPVNSGCSYSLSFWANITSQYLSALTVYLEWYNTSKSFISSTTATTLSASTVGWSNQTSSASAPLNAAYVDIQFNAGMNAGGGMTAYIDDLSLTGTQTSSASFYAARAVNSNTGQVSPFTSWILPVVQSRPVGTPLAAHIQEDYTNAIQMSSTLAAGVGVAQGANGFTDTGWNVPIIGSANPVPETWVYVSATSFKVAGLDVTARYPVGTKLRCKQGGGYVYGYVDAAPTFSTDTTIRFNGGSDYSLSNATITDNYYSYAESPVNFPDWFNWSPTYTGFSASPTDDICRFTMKGREVICTVNPVNGGTSNATTFTMTGPVTARNVTNKSWYAAAVNGDNGAYLTAIGVAYIGSNSNVITLAVNGNLAANGWTAAGIKGTRFTLIYEA